MTMRRDLCLSRAPVAGFVCVGLYWGSFAALVPVLKPQAGLSDGGFGLAMLVAALGAVLAMWLAPLADAKLGRHAMPVLAVGMAAAFMVPGLATGAVPFAAAMLVGSMMSGTLDVVMNARVSALEAQSRRPLMNMTHAMFSFGYAGAAFATGLLREAGLGPVAIFGLMGLCSLGLAWVMSGDTTGSEAQPEEVSEGRALQWGLLIPGGVIIAVAFMSEQATEGWSALHLERGLGAGASGGALGPTILGLTMGLGRLSGQLLVRRYSEARVMQAAATLSAAGALVAAFATSVPMAYVGFGILGLGISVVAPMAFAWIGRLVRADQRVLAISRISVIGYAGFFLGPPLMGGLSQTMGLDAAFTAIGAFLLCIPLVLVPLLRRAAR